MNKGSMEFSLEADILWSKFSKQYQNQWYAEGGRPGSEVRLRGNWGVRCLTSAPIKNSLARYKESFLHGNTVQHLALGRWWPNWQSTSTRCGL